MTGRFRAVASPVLSLIALLSLMLRSPGRLWSLTIEAVMRLGTIRLLPSDELPIRLSHHGMVLGRLKALRSAPTDCVGAKGGLDPASAPCSRALLVEQGEVGVDGLAGLNGWFCVAAPLPPEHRALQPRKSRSQTVDPEADDRSHGIGNFICRWSDFLFDAEQELSCLRRKQRRYQLERVQRLGRCRESV